MGRTLKGVTTITHFYETEGNHQNLEIRLMTFSFFFTIWAFRRGLSGTLRYTVAEKANRIEKKDHSVSLFSYEPRERKIQGEGNVRTQVNFHRYTLGPRVDQARNKKKGIRQVVNRTPPTPKNSSESTDICPILSNPNSMCLM